jgi:hypothetical protein
MVVEKVSGHAGTKRELERLVVFGSCASRRQRGHMIFDFFCKLFCHKICALILINININSEV